MSKNDIFEKCQAFFKMATPLKFDFSKSFVFNSAKKLKSLMSDKKSVGCATKTLEVRWKNVRMDMDLACYGIF